MYLQYNETLKYNYLHLYIKATSEFYKISKSDR